MDLKIFIVLFCALFTGGNSLQCYKCSGIMGCGQSNVTTCPGTAACAATVQSIDGLKMQSKGCGVTESCISGSVNLGVTRTVTSTQCCTTDLCNNKDPPDSSSNSPNGKQCYYCNDDTSCFNKLNCLGDEDRCLTETVTVGSVSVTVKGCVSKSICDAASQSQAPEDYTRLSCCQGNLCNGAKSVTQNLLFLLWPLFFFILIH
ncbi:urokinase plasminogen activator surface receptor-like [Paramisgurnus dabryanus]|uniref:urokinase plasminogen activator surface receptor-like n=1 Tax=Paramisgurnus dabryanus TaxID=90735 RepID=UPI003CCEFB75